MNKMSLILMYSAFWFVLFSGSDIPASASRTVDEEDANEDEFGAKDYRDQMELKSDHSARPLWLVSNNGCQLFYQIVTSLLYSSPFPSFHSFLYIRFAQYQSVI